VKAVLFDLDYTLYDARQYFLGAFESISKYVSSKYNIPEQKVYEELDGIWRNKTSMYPHMFDDLLEFFHIDRDSPEVVKAIVKKFNEYTGEMEPYPDTIPTLHILKERGCKLGIITDGDVERQKRKIERLRLAPLFDVIVYAKELESKPSPAPFLAVLANLSVKDADSFYIGDNPLIDFQGAKEVGVTTIRILRGEFNKVPRNEYIDFEIESLDKLPGIVEHA
jgi:putative hydrolase of the HAD superfamily